jgi:hypothetical protein
VLRQVQPIVGRHESSPGKLLRITIAVRPNPTSVANVLQLHVDIVGVGEMRLLGVDASANRSFYSGRRQLSRSQSSMLNDANDVRAELIQRRDLSIPIRNEWHVTRLVRPARRPASVAAR